MKKYLSILLLAFSLCACNEDGLITRDIGGLEPPVISLDSEAGVYTVKIGRELTVAPSYSNVEDALYSWTCGGRTLSTGPVLVCSFDSAGSHIVTLRVETPAGTAREEIRIDVTELAPPVISLAVPDGGLDVPAGREYRFAPDILNGEEASFLWTLDGCQVGTGAEYVFCRQETGSYELSLRVENEDGCATKTITVNVVENLPVEITVAAPSFRTEKVVKTVALGRTLRIRPYVKAESGVEFRWSLDGEPIEGASDRMYEFTPEAVGEYTLTFTVSRKNGAAQKALTRNIVVTGTDEISADIPVVCCPAPKARPFAAGCSAECDRVCEFVPAPGQFVNETGAAGYDGVTTFEAAAEYARGRLAAGSYVSLGGWGGYIVVGFDHSIENRGGYDFSIMGNAFDSSNEPGIVYVMQDTNGNGLPDDEWYELKGSEYGSPDTVQEYAVTYYRPGPGMDTPWTDNLGGSGCIDYLGDFHPQEYYYPQWIESDSYTLFGTRLKARNFQDPQTGFWTNPPFGGGYADNMGSDMQAKENPEAGAVPNYFKISDAVDIDGSPAQLAHIDFIKVQTGVNAKSGWIGENSTEVLGFTDENNRQRP